MHKILRILFGFRNRTHYNCEEQVTLTNTISVFNISQWVMWSDFFKNTCEGVNF